MPELQSRVIRLLIVDDHAMFREGIAAVLDREPDFEVVGKCPTAHEALGILDREAPSLILLDFDLGSELAVDFARQVKSRGFKGQVLVVTAGVSEQEALQLVQAGVAGILHKHNPPETLCGTIRQVAAGEVCLEKSYLRPLFRSLDQSRPGDDARL